MPTAALPHRAGKALATQARNPTIIRRWPWAAASRRTWTRTAGLLYSTRYDPRRGGRPGGPARRRPRRLAALRLPRARTPLRRGWPAWRTRGHRARRRWYYLIPRDGTPRKLVHAIERHNLDAPARRDDRVRRPRARSTSGLTTLVGRPAPRRDGVLARVRHPVSRPASTRARSTRCGSGGVEVVSSGDLVQRFEAAWDEAALATHRDASTRLYRVKDRTLAFLRDRARRRRAADRIRRPDGDGALVRRRRARQRQRRPSSRRRRTPATRTTCPTARGIRPIGRERGAAARSVGQARARPAAVFADISWMTFTGTRVPERRRRRVGTPSTARATPPSPSSRPASATGDDLRGWQVDQAARQRARSTRASPTTSCIARDTASARTCTATACTWTTTRRTTIGGCIPGTGFTVEPGLYFEDFGVRTEINITVGDARRDRHR